MSLLAWYPLNGDYKNYGLLGDEAPLIVNVTPAYSDNGISGKCLSTGAFDWSASTTNKILNHKQLTIAFWWKNLSSAEGKEQIFGNDVMSTNGGRKFSLFRFSQKSYLHWSWQTDVETTPIEGNYRSHSGTYNDFFTDDEWTHVCIVYDSPNAYLYKNGTYITRMVNDYPFTESTFEWTTKFLYNSSSRMTCDWRFYDEALTKEQIKDVYNNLVLHYDFEDVIVPIANERYNTNLSIYNNYQTITANLSQTGEYFEGSPIWRLKMKTTDASTLNHLQTSIWGHGVMWGGNNFDVNETLVSGILWRPISHSDTQVGGTASNNYGTYSFGTNTELYHNGWKRFNICRKNTTETAGTDGIYISTICPSLALDEELIIEFCQPEQYRGIDYVPVRNRYTNEAELTIFDSSGYGHHGTIIQPSKVKLIKGGKEGNCCLDVNYSDYTVTCDKIFYDNLNQCHTVNFWYKKNENGTQKAINFNSGYFINFYASDNRSLAYINSGANDCYVYGSAIPLNEWTMVTWVFNRNNGLLKVYYNGILDANSGFSEEQIKTRLPSGFSSPTKFFQLYGQVDDFRIYGNELSAEDILSLYKVKATVGKNEQIKTNNILEESIFDKDNLIYNGMLELRNSDGFWGVTYDSTDSYRGSNGSLTVTGVFRTGTQSDYFFIPINPDDTYKLEMDIKWTDMVNNKYISVRSFDQNKNEISFYRVNHYANTETTLTKELKNGDTTIEIADASNWKEESDPAYQKRIGLYTMPEYGYSMSKYLGDYSPYFLKATGNVLTLAEPWTKGTYPVGTKIANAYDGSTYYYPTMYYINANGQRVGTITFTPQNIMKEWNHYEATFKGSSIRNYVNYVDFLIAGGETGYKVTNIKFTNISSPQTITTVIGKDKQEVTKTAIVKAEEFVEVGMPIRYIRDYCGENNVNNSSHWTQIEAFNNVGQNVALGKNVTSENTFGGTRPLKEITNGDTNCAYWAGSNANASVTVDLGFIEKIDKIIVWHYYSDGRVYENTKTQVSADGTNWYTIFDSSKDKTYVETSSGHTMYITPDKFSINKSGKIYSQGINEI